VRETDLSGIRLQADLSDRRITADYVADALRQAIHRGDLADGAVLNQAALAAHFGVSRVPVREAMRQLQAEIGTSFMFITHNMGVVAQMCDEVAVMYLGRIVERALVDDIFYDPKHPYTISLLRSIPRLGANRGMKLETIRGSVPDPYSTVSGCPFHPRCPAAIPGLCDTVMPEEIFVGDSRTHTVRCHLYT